MLFRSALRFVKEQTAEICLAAVKQNSWTLQFVEDQTEEICLEAVRQDNNVINFVNLKKFPNIIILLKLKCA